MPDPKLTLVLPVYRGASFLARSLADAHAWLAQLEGGTELLVVDDGSDDGSAAILEAFQARVAGLPGPEVRLLRNDRNCGKGYSLRRAFLHARGAFVVFTDADLTYPIENVAPLVAALADGADVAIGSRMHRDSRYVVAPSFFGYLFTRHLSGRVFNLLVRMLAVPGILDTQAGLKGFRREAARRLAPRIRLGRFSFDVELLFVARRLGLRIVDCPVRFIYRKEPSTVRFVRDSLAMVRDIVRVRWRGWRKAYDPEPSPAAVQALRDGAATATVPGAGPRRVTFVADDLGVSAGVNNGIARAARAGLVREASVCVTGAAVEEGVALARDLGLGIGLHLSFTLGRALTGAVRGLTDAEGHFFGLRRVLWNCVWRRVDLTGAARETRAQFARLRQMDVVPTHLNGHHHVHCFPGLRQVVFEVAATEGVRWTRLPREHRAARRRLHPATLLLGHLARRTEPVVRAAGMHALPFVGLGLEARTDYRDRFARVADRLPEGDYEWMLHPREPDAEFERQDRRGAGRQAAARAELDTLIDPGLVARWQRDGIVVTTFGERAG